MAEERRSRVILKEHEIYNTYTSDYPGKCPNVDDTWKLEKLKKDLKIQVNKLNDLELEFDIINLDVAIVNAIRRILLAEVPTMAIEKVFMYNNTSIIQDEVLSHRLGLIPIKVDPRLFEYRQEGDEEGSAEDTIEFALKIKCTKNAQSAADATNPDDLYLNHQVFSKHLQWTPVGSQKDLYNDIRPCYEDILIAKLRSGHEIDLKVHCVKGIGKDHAKFSPVATASYRMLPEIKILKDVVGEQAERLATCFSEGVIKLEDKGGKKIATVADARMDTCSRNIFRFEDLKDLVKLSRIRNHLIFSVESTGALTPDILVEEAIKVLMNKCKTYLEELKSVN